MRDAKAFGEHSRFALCSPYCFHYSHVQECVFTSGLAPLLKHFGSHSRARVPSQSVLDLRSNGEVIYADFAGVLCPRSVCLSVAVLFFCCFVACYVSLLMFVVLPWCFALFRVAFNPVLRRLFRVYLSHGSPYVVVRFFSAFLVAFCLVFGKSCHGGLVVEPYCNFAVPLYLLDPLSSAQYP